MNYWTDLHHARKEVEALNRLIIADGPRRYQMPGGRLNDYWAIYKADVDEAGLNIRLYTLNGIYFTVVVVIPIYRGS